MGIEPTQSAWKAEILPLNYTRATKTTLLLYQWARCLSRLFIRKFKKFTQEQLAELVDIDVRQIARIEACESLPSIPTLLKLCSVFTVSPNDLLEFSTNTTDENASLKSDINDILTLAKPEQLELIKKLILAVL